MMLAIVGTGLAGGGGGHGAGIRDADIPDFVGSGAPVMGGGFGGGPYVMGGGVDDVFRPRPDRQKSKCVGLRSCPAGRRAHH